MKTVNPESHVVNTTLKGGFQEGDCEAQLRQTVIKKKIGERNGVLTARALTAECEQASSEPPPHKGPFSPPKRYSRKSANTRLLRA